MPYLCAHSAEPIILEVFKVQLQINEVLNARLEAIERELSYNSLEPEEGA